MARWKGTTRRTRSCRASADIRLGLAAEHLPPASVAQCAHCGQQMQLLVQIFAPLEDSPYDRNLFVWGCARAACQHKGEGRYVASGGMAKG